MAEKLNEAVIQFSLDQKKTWITQGLVFSRLWWKTQAPKRSVCFAWGSHHLLCIYSRRLDSAPHRGDKWLSSHSERLAALVPSQIDGEMFSARRSRRHWIWILTTRSQPGRRWARNVDATPAVPSWLTEERRRAVEAKFCKALTSYREVSITWQLIRKAKDFAHARSLVQ